MALIAAFAGLLAAVDPATDEAVAGALDAIVSAVGSTECASTADCLRSSINPDELGVAAALPPAAP